MIYDKLYNRSFQMTSILDNQMKTQMSDYLGTLINHVFFFYFFNKLDNELYDSLTWHLLNNEGIKNDEFTVDS